MGFTGEIALVTGATGLIGAEVARQLTEAGAEVICAVRDPSRARGRHVLYDAEQKPEFSFRARYIVHAAVSAHPLAYAQDPAGVMRANILGTMHLLDYARETGARMIFLSSGEVYGQAKPPEAGFTEADAGVLESMDARACYPESKRAAETMVASWVKQYGVDAIVARLCHVYGAGIAPGNSRADAQFLRRAAAGEDIVMKSAGDQVRSYLYVKDAARGILTLLQKGERGQAYNVAGREVSSIREYAQTLADIAGVRLVFENPDDIERSGYSKVARAVLDPARVEGLGFVPAYTLETGLRETYQLFRGRAVEG
ncbi:MAG: NAD-dependent epimerase/dehydratase family protein [Christensenellales bacterium]|jgi:UDP-glucuronate decarboxylase